MQSALDEFSSLGRTGFLARYGFGKPRDFLVRNPVNGELCDSKAIVGAAFGYQYPDDGPLKPADFSGGGATVAPELQSLGFKVVRIGEDWSQQEVDATVELRMLCTTKTRNSYLGSDEVQEHLRESEKKQEWLNADDIDADAYEVLPPLGIDGKMDN